MGTRIKLVARVYACAWVATQLLAADQEAIRAGKELFANACSACHGSNGEGSHGPSLTEGDEIRRLKDSDLVRIIRNGVPGSDMPAFQYTDGQVREVVAYVRSLNAPASEANPPGDPVAGRKLLFGKGGCASCHMRFGQGGFPGPDLSNIGSSRTVVQLRQVLLKPNEHPRSDFRTVTVVSKSGQKIRGVAKFADNYSITVLDAKGELHLLAMQDLSQVAFDAKSMMPDDYGRRLTTAEIDDLIAYLSRSETPDQTAPSKRGAGVAFEEIRQGPAKDWLTYSGDYSGQRHSALAQIHRENVKSLVPAWVYHMEGARHLETTPLVYEGVMYATDTNAVEALDARTGRRIWRYHAEGVKTQRVNRGVALLGDRVYLVTGDAHLIALQRATGSLIWDHEYASAAKGYFSTMAPLAVKDKILVGVGGGGSGQRGFVAALSADTGTEVWRFWTVPSKGQPGADSWGNFPLEWAGSPTWTSGSYDPDLNLVYWPTGNPWPDYYGANRPGANLYSDCVVALDADTGKLSWYFQFTPHDTHDWDANESLVLVDAAYQGRTRKLLVQANRNGFYYVLDRTNGKFLAAKQFVEKMNWAKGVDDNGHPVEIAHMDPTPAGTRVCPSTRGANNWMSSSYDPKTGLLYVVALEQCDIYSSSAKEPQPSSGFHGTGSEQIPDEPGVFYLRALDATSGTLRWEHKMPGPATMWAGTVSTAGGLVFTGDDDGNLVALNSATGEDLWHFSTGHWLSASPMTFEVAGRQYVSIAAETDIVTFALFRDSGNNR